MNLRVYKYRIYPNKAQAEYLAQNFGAARFLWNQLVANFNEYSSQGPNRPCNEKLLKDEHMWMKDLMSSALQQKRMDFDETKKQYFSKTRKKKLGKMKFKKRGVSKDSFRLPGQALGYNKCIDLKAGKIKLQKMDPIRATIHREFKGDVRSLTVSRNKANQYFVSVLVQEETELKQNTGRSIGIDLGLTHLATLSNGAKIENPRWFRESQSKLVKEQRVLSRRTRGSGRYKKQKLKVAKIHQKIANQRNDFHHKLSNHLVLNFDHILMEDLNLAGMKKMLGKSLSDAGLGSLVQMIKYKAGWYGKSFHQVSTWYPSSKTCNSCGTKVDAMPLEIREWTCSCGAIHDRDINAARNIHDEGLRDLYQFSAEELTSFKIGQEMSKFTLVETLEDPSRRKTMEAEVVETRRSSRRVAKKMLRL